MTRLREDLIPKIEQFFSLPKRQPSIVKPEAMAVPAPSVPSPALQNAPSTPLPALGTAVLAAKVRPKVVVIVVWGMPGAVVRAGFADRVLPLNQVVPAILRLTNQT